MKRIDEYLTAWLRRILDKIAPKPAIHYIGGSDSLPPPLDPDEEYEALLQLSLGDWEARGVLIEHNLRLVVYIARKFESTGIGLEDLISIGTIGLIKAINTFDREKKNKLATYASRCIENEILMFIRRNGKTRREISFDEPLNVDWDGNELLLSDVLGTDGDLVYRRIEDEDDRTQVHNAVNTLDERDRHIMVLRFGLDNRQERTQKEVADLLGISQSYISRLEKRILRQLRHVIVSMNR